MPFIVHTPPAHRGIVLYVTKAEPPFRSLKLEGFRKRAVEFPTRLDADVARRRFSSLHGLEVFEVKGRML